MGTNLEWFQKTFYNISHDDDVINSLSDIKVALSAMNTNQRKYTSSSLNLSGIFDCLNSSSKNQIELACEVLQTFLGALDPSTVLSQYGIAVVRALNHPNVAVKELVLNQLIQAAQESDLAPRLSQEQDLLLSVVECVAHKNCQVARGAIQFLVRLGTTSPGLTAIFSPTILQALNKVMETNDTNRFRVYEIVVDISDNSEPGLIASHSSGILEKLLLELKKDDPLVLLTTLEFVTKLALSHHGYKYLESQGVVKHLADQMLKLEEPLKAIVLQGLIRFFGNVTQLKPQETFRDYPAVVEVLFKTVHEDDPNLACVALETVGFIATTASGKRMLHKQGTIMKEVMKKIIEVIKKCPTEYRVRSLNSLANMIKLELSEQDTEMLAVVQSWFGLLGPPGQTMAQVADMSHLPFLEIKLAAFLLLQVLADLPWGQQYIHDTPGLVELILDRTNDSRIQEKQARFEVINILADSPTSESVFGEETVKHFRKYLHEGVSYKQMVTEVAIEKAD